MRHHQQASGAGGRPVTLAATSQGAPIPPTLANGKICYVEIPATDAHRSAEFYEQVFGWRIRQRGDGAIAFDDTTEEVSGTWVTGRAASPESGLLLYVMVDSVELTVEAVIAQGGELVQPIGADTPEITARISDPAGNVIGLYQEPDAGGGGDESDFRALHTHSPELTDV